MKRFLTTLFAVIALWFILVAFSAFGQSTNRTPINNGFLQSALNGNGQSITNAHFVGDGSGLTNVTGTGGGSQSPLTNNLNGGGYNIFNVAVDEVGTLEVTNDGPSYLTGPVYGNLTGNAPPWSIGSTSSGAGVFNDSVTSPHFIGSATSATNVLGAVGTNHLPVNASYLTNLQANAISNNVNLIPSGAMYDNGDSQGFPVYGPFTLNTNILYFQFNPGEGNGNDQGTLSSPDFSQGYAGCVVFKPLYTNWFLWSDNPTTPVLTSIYPCTNIYSGAFGGTFFGDLDPSIFIPPSLLQIPASYVQQPFTNIISGATSPPYGIGTLSGTAGSHTVTFGTSQNGVRRGWQIATLSDHAQYVVVETTTLSGNGTSFTVMEINGGGGLVNTYSATTNWQWNYNAADWNDVDGHPAGGVQGDGSSFIIGNHGSGVIANSANYYIINGSNTMASYVNTLAGSAFYGIYSFSNKDIVRIFGSAPTASLTVQDVTGSVLEPYGLYTSAITVTNGIASLVSNGGSLTSIASFPATTVNWTNTTGKNMFVFINNSGVTGTAVKLNGTTIFTVLTSETIPLGPGDYFSETYTIGTPSAYYKLE